MTTFLDTLEAAAQGDREASEALFDRWRPLLRLQASQLLGVELLARVDPSDVVQESLTQAYTDLARFEGKSEAQWVAWLRTIIMGQSAKTRRFHTADKRNAKRDEIDATADFVTRSSATPVERLVDLEQAAEVATAIEQLPEEMQTAIVERFFCHSSWEQIASRLERSTGAARVLGTRAVKKLKEILEEGHVTQTMMPRDHL